MQLNMVAQSRCLFCPHAHAGRTLKQVTKELLASGICAQNLNRDGAFWFVFEFLSTNMRAIYKHNQLSL